MKKTAIGCALMLGGTWMVGCIFIAAVLFVPHMSSWEGTRVWYAIFGGGPYEADLKQSMALGLPFAIGALMLVSGIAILAVEYFRPDKRREPAPAAARSAELPAEAPLRPAASPLSPQSHPAAGTLPPAGETGELPTMKEVRP